jgi:hypothetical protein
MLTAFCLKMRTKRLPKYEPMANPAKKVEIIRLLVKAVNGLLKMGHFGS